MGFLSVYFGLRLSSRQGEALCSLTGGYHARQPTVTFHSDISVAHTLSHTHTHMLFFLFYLLLYFLISLRFRVLSICTVIDNILNNILTLLE